MHIFLVVWLSVAQDCPFWAKPLPREARAFICTAQNSMKTAVFDPVRRRDAERLMETLGPGSTAVLLEVRGTQARAVSSVWRNVLEVGK